MAYMGSQWCGTPEDTVAALAHTLQAVAYLLKGKDECAKKASKVTFWDSHPRNNPSKPYWHHESMARAVLQTRHCGAFSLSYSVCSLLGLVGL